MGSFTNLIGRDWVQVTSGAFARLWFQHSGLEGVEVARAADGVAPVAGQYTSTYREGEGDRGDIKDILPPAVGVAEGGAQLWARSLGNSSFLKAGWE
jgi:hypothetical protein